MSEIPISPITTFSTINSYGKINDYLRLRKEQEINSNTKFIMSPKTVYYSTDSFIPTEFIEGAKANSGNNPKEVSNIEKNNQVNFQSGKSINLGMYSGEPIELKDFGGRMITPFEVPPPVASRPGQKPNALEERAEELAKKIPNNQSKEIFAMCNAIEVFNKVTDGKISVQSQTVTKNTNDAMKTLLVKMGIDLNKPFSINGEEFYVRSDNGKIDYLNVKKYMKNGDGTITIQSVNNYKVENNKIVEL